MAIVRFHYASLIVHSDRTASSSAPVEPEGWIKSEISEELVNHGAMGFPGGTIGKESICQCRRHKRCGFNTWIGKIPLEEGIATHSSVLAWKMPWTEEFGGLQSIGLQRVGHD